MLARLVFSFFTIVVIFAIFKHHGNVDDFIEPFMPEKKYLVDISVSPFITQVEIRTFREAFLLYNVKTSFLCILFRNFFHLLFFKFCRLQEYLDGFRISKQRLLFNFQSYL